MLSISYLFETEEILNASIGGKYRSQFIKRFKDTTVRNDHILYVAIVSGKLVGGITITEKQKNKIYNRYHLKPEAEIGFFYVSPKYRNRGLGRKLINIPLKKYKSVGLSTHDGYTNQRAKQIYTNVGFKIIHGNQNKIKYWYWEKKSSTTPPFASSGRGLLGG